MIFANYYQPDRVKNASFEEIDRHHTYNPTFTNRLLRAEFLKRGIELKAEKSLLASCMTVRQSKIPLSQNTSLPLKIRIFALSIETSNI